MCYVLIVDDELRTCEGIRRHVQWEKLGIADIRAFSDTAAALAFAQTEEIALLITDIRMPGMTGIEFAGRVRELHPNCNLIFISAYADREYYKAAIKMQAIDYIEKPVDVAELTNAIARAFANYSASRGNVREEYGAAFAEAVGQGNLLSAWEALSEFFRSAESRNMEIEQVRRWCRSASGALLEAAFGHQDGVFRDSIVHESLGEVENADALKALMEQLLSVLMQESVRSTSDRMIQTVIVHCAINLDRTDLVVAQLARKVYITPNYLSSIFRKEMGQTISQFILHARMEMAKWLLADHGLTRSDVARRVGVGDVNYFSKLFKKVTGTSPSDYALRGRHN